MKKNQACRLQIAAILIFGINKLMMDNRLNGSYDIIWIYLC